MAVIKSGATSDQLTVDQVSKAARVTLYDTTGAVLASFPVSGAVSVSNFPASQAVTGTFFPATQPVSAAALPLPSGASTEATLALIKAKTDNLDVLLSTRTKPADSQTVTGSISVSNFPASQPVTGTFFQGTQPVSGPLTDGQLRASPPTMLEAEWRAATLAVTATGAAAAAVTATLPAVSGQFHYITSIELVAYSTVARVGGITPVLITSTNLPGSPAWTLASAAAVGTTDRIFVGMTTPLKSSVANTATTIVGPATASVIWRINVQYFTAP